MFPDYRAGTERGNRFVMDGRISLVSFILKRSDRETFWAQFGNTKMNPNDTFGLVTLLSGFSVNRGAGII